MALSCGSKCAKYILFAFNILIWICGAIVLGVGVWFLAGESALQLIHIATVNTSSELIRGTAIALVTVGSLAFITGFFGCCGAFKESPCMLQTYAVILGMLLVLQVAAGIAGAVFRNRISNELGMSMNKTVTEQYTFNSTDETTKAFDYMQEQFKCCGAYGPQDWAHSEWRKHSGKEPVPLTCCVMQKEKEVPVNKTACYDAANSATSIDTTYLHREGCQEQLQEWVNDHAGIIIGVALGLAVVQVVAVIIACGLRKSVQSQYQYV